MKRDQYGLQPEKREAAKSALQRILDAHAKAAAEPQVSPQDALARLRAVHAEEKAAWQAREAEMAAAQAARDLHPPAPAPEVEAPAPVVAAPAEPAVDYLDGTWIQELTPETTTYRDNMAEEHYKVWHVGTGRYIITFRKRTPADGDLAYVILKPNIPAPSKPPTMDRHSWFSGDNARGPYASVEANRARLRAADERPRLGSTTPGSKL